MSPVAYLPPLAHDAGVRGDLPSGTVTFLFADVEGSTRLLHELGTNGYAEVLAKHRTVLREVLSSQEASRSMRKVTLSSMRLRLRRVRSRRPAGGAMLSSWAQSGCGSACTRGRRS